ncbi:MAG: 2TM domain-containing protein [Bacteroidota bacterium]
MKLIENSSEKRYQRAKERVEKMKGFYIHASIYFIFVIFFIYLNTFSSSFPWAIFPIVGWGLGVLGHATDAFEYSIFFGKKWEQRKIREILKEEEEEFIQF